MNPMTRILCLVCVSATVLVGTGIAPAGGPPANPDYRIVMPSNTGIPGYTSMLFVDFGPDGRLWTTGRDFFFQQGGVAALDFSTGRWATYSSLETPLGQWSYDVAFAGDGSTWIASENTVARLHADGTTFTAYTPANTGVLVDGSNGTVDIDSNGHVWVANYGQIDLGGGLFEFDGTQWTKHEEPWMVTWTGVGVAPPLNVFARSNGDVWASFLSSPNCMGRYRNGAWTQITSGPFIIDMAETADGTLFGVGSAGTYRYNDATGQWQQIGSIGSFTIALDPVNGYIYVVQGLTSVARFDGSSWSTFATFPGWIDAVGVGPDGDVWITAEAWSTHVDLHRYSPSGQLLRVYNRSNTGMLTYSPPGMYLDHAGHMWFTDAEYGASRLEPNENWRNFGVYNGQEEVYPFWVSPVGLPWWQTPGADFWTESVDQVFSDSEGNIWLRGPNAIARSHGDDLSQWDRWVVNQSGFPPLCDSMGQDSTGVIWLSDAFGLYRLDGTSWTEVPIGIPGQFAPSAFVQGGDGELYAVRISTVYRVVAPATITPLYTLPDDFGIISALEVDAAGTLWVGTPDNGLLRRSGGTTTIFTPANSGLAELTIVDVAIRPGDGLVAVSTTQQTNPPYDGGVALFDGQSWTRYDFGEGFLPHYGVGDLQFDANGHLWIGVLNFGAVQVYTGDGQPQPLIGDIDADGDVDLEDKTLFVAVLTGTSANPDAAARCDLNEDGLADGGDVQPFVLALMQ